MNHILKMMLKMSHLPLGEQMQYFLNFLVYEHEIVVPDPNVF